MGDFGLLGAWLLLVAVLAVAVLIAILGVRLSDRVLARGTGPEHNSVLSPFLTVTGLVYGALLGFTVVVGWQQFLTAQVNVSNEASALTTLYRQTVAMPQPEQSQVREQLRTYAEGLQGPRWGKEQFSEINNSARTALTEMYRIVGGPQTGSTASPINSQFLSELSVLASDRSARILNSKPRIPPLLWCSLLFGSALLITLTSFMRLTNDRAHMLLVSAVTVLLGLLLYLVYVLDHPFGPMGVTPEPFSHAVTVFDLVDQES